MALGRTKPLSLGQVTSSFPSQGRGEHGRASPRRGPQPEWSGSLWPEGLKQHVAASPVHPDARRKKSCHCDCHYPEWENCDSNSDQVFTH